MNHSSASKMITVRTAELLQLPVTKMEACDVYPTAIEFNHRETRNSHRGTRVMCAKEQTHNKTLHIHDRCCGHYCPKASKK